LNAAFYAGLAVFFACAALVLGVMLWRSVRFGKKLLDDSFKLSAVFAAIPDLVYCMDKDMRYTSVNKAFEAFAGKPLKDIVGKTNDYVFADKKSMAAYFSDMNTKVLKERKTLAVQEWATSSGGVKMFLDVVKMPLYRDGELAGLVGIARDITAHKAAETRALEASKVKDRFIANMSHEIRTPLNAIIGMSEFMSLEPLPDRQRNCAKDISTASRSLLSIVNGILDFSKTEGDESKIARPNAEGGKVPFSAPDAKVLVVDDNNLNLKVACRLLGLYGISADTASSGREAVIAVQRTAYDLVLMDHMMPDMNGIQAAAKIRALGGKYFKLPIIALTANATRGVQEIFLSSGLDDYMSKPIELDKLSKILKKWIPVEKTGGALKDAPRMIGEPAGSGGLWEDIGKVSGINAEVGKNRVAGMEEMYRETLELFCDKTPRECAELSEYLDAGNMEDFAILAHGMKSSLLTIGAMRLAETALELETAGKAGDREKCSEIMPGFAERARGLIAEINAKVLKV